MTHRSLLSAATLVLSGCQPTGDMPEDGRISSTEDVQPVSSTASGEWVVSPTGAATLRIGMSLSDLLSSLEPGTDTLAIANGCEYVSVSAAPEEVGFMVEGRRLVRIDVWDPRIPTAEGARVSDTEERILSLYPAARRLPHEYADGYYLIVLLDAPADTLHRYVFETDGKRVTTYRAGLYPPVEYIEGCS